MIFEIFGLKESAGIIISNVSFLSKDLALCEAAFLF
jgi:hypothetical protein